MIKMYRNVLILLVFSLASCSLFEDELIDENTAIEVIDVLLPEAQLGIVSAAGGEYAVFPAVFMQQLAGLEGKLLGIDTYQITPGHTDDVWQRYYLNVFSNLNTIIRVADDAGLHKAGGMARIMMAHALGLVTSAWGSVPFSDNFLTDNISLSPRYDPQHVLYDKIFTLLSEGVDHMKATGYGDFPSGQDIYFGGNSDEWIKFARFLGLRYKLHLTGREGYTGLLDLIGNDFFSYSGEKYEVIFSDYEGFSHSLYEFLLTNPGSVGAGLFFVGQMNTTDDPRLSVYFKTSESGDIEGSAPGEGRLSASRLSSSFVSSGSAVILASYTEQKFIESEIYLMNYMIGEAVEAFNEGLRSSLTEHNVFDELWFQQHKASSGLTLEQIIYGKYAALFLHPEIWSDWRRTGYPALEAAPGNNTNDRIPRRLPYPQSEYLYNTDNVPHAIEITTPVWWDVK